MVLYSEFPELNISRTFTPAEAGLLTGISPEKQRQIRHQGFAHFLDQAPSTGKHSRFGWRTVTLWALMAEAGNLGFGLNEAGYFAAGFSHLRPSPGDTQSRAQLLDYDFRLGKDGRSVPLYVFCFPEMGKPESFANLVTGSGNVDFNGEWKFDGRWGWWLNYSDFQRRLLMRYESIK
ncbi:hypothetical protein NKH53_27990 [Mesorhizobium australicum]|uniref:hypothetical protein n=1 Tax=Mesorhizobium australicum TaxID=536018 RepID=UPI00333D7837